MNTLTALLQHHGLKLVLALKLGVLTLIVVDQQLLWVGEKPVLGQQDSNESATRSDSETASDSEADDQADGQPKSTTAAGRSMGELLTLPEIDSSQLKKSELSKYFSTLKRKEARIQARINLLKDREAQLRNLEQSIEQKLRKLEDEIAYFKQTQQKEKQVQQDRLEKLVNFYKKMRPKEAAPVFERMDRDLVVELFNRIPQKQTMNILAKMTPEKSVELSEYFGRIRSAKEYELLKEINTSLLEEFEECKRQP